MLIHHKHIITIKHQQTKKKKKKKNHINARKHFKPPQTLSLTQMSYILIYIFLFINMCTINKLDCYLTLL